MKFLGLNDEQVRESREKYGTNALAERQVEGFMDKLKGNFEDPMIKILCVALLINIVLAFLGQSEWYESVGIAMAVILATFVSTLSEYKNENAFQKLQAEASQILCKIYRNDTIVEESIDQIVVGDCILLQTGDKTPADGVLVDGTIQVDQSVLNGEAKEARKYALEEGEAMPDEDAAVDFLDRCSVFRGSVVCSGNAVMQVTKVGEKSVYGKIASELQVDVERDTPLKLKLGKLAQQISKFGYFGGVAVAAAYMFQRIVIHNGFDMVRILAYCSNWMTVLGDAVEAVMLAVIIIVMAVPEGLPLMIAIVSAQNMSKMLKDNVLVRKIAGIETAGSLNLLFSDKTGTITKGQLEVVDFVDGNGQSYGAFAKISQKLQELVQLSIRYNTSAVISGEGEKQQIVGGNMTDRAVLGYAAGSAGPLPEVKVTDSLPFNSKDKYSAAHVSGAYELTLMKGAPEKILARCESFYDADGNKQPLAAGENAVSRKIDELASRAIRVLALAVSEDGLQENALQENTWTLVGVLGIRDDVREDAVEAIHQVQRAGVQVVMITGDRKDTAMAIAREAGIIRNADDVALTSDELSALSDEEVKRQLPKLAVVSRALPSDKSRLVRLAQELNLVVGMTGDGVNDSPALKQADVGFAMGGGTEVAKEASEIVILDDNFSSIEKAILYGRTIFNSIRKFIIFQLTINVGAVLISFVAPLLGFENPLSITQILWVNLVMDTLAALAFGGEPALQRYMEEKPKRRDEQIVSPLMWSSILTGSLWSFVLSLMFILSSFAASHFRPSEDNLYLLTGYFAFFIMLAVFNAFNARTEKLNLFDHITQNKGFLEVMAIITAVQIGMTYLGGEVLRCYGMTVSEWAFVLLMAVTIIPVDLIRKCICGNKK